MIIQNLENVDFNTLFSGFERAFSDYEIHFDKNEVRSMLVRRGFDPRLSFAAFEDGQIVAFTLNGIGRFNDVRTAYDTGTGTIKEFRGQGLAGEIFKYSLPYLKEAGIKQYLLEVLKNNHKAITVYCKLGFEVIREFDCFRQALSKITVESKTNEKCICSIKPIDKVYVSNAQSFCDFPPSWQNSINSIERGLDNLTMLGAFVDNSFAGYCVIDANTGDLTQIAVAREYRRRGIATQLLHAATERMHTDFIKVLNISTTDKTLHAFLCSQNIAMASNQLEMKLLIK